MAAASWGQVDLNNLNTLRNNIPAGVNNTLNRPNNMPDTASSADTSNGPKGIIYHVDIPDSVLQASVFMFNKLARNIKIMAVEHPKLSPTGAHFSDCLDAFNGNYYLTVTELGHPHLSIVPIFDATPGLVYKSNIYPG